MPHRGRALAHSFIVTLLIGLAAAGPATAFPPEASVWLASRLPEALPPAARDPLWATETNRALERLELEQADAPEWAELLSRFDVRRTRPGGATPSSEDSLGGLAAYALATATADLRDALRRRNAAEAARAIAEIAQSVADLSDPFLTTPPDPLETPGARAWFCDGFTLDDMAGAVVPNWLAPDALTVAFMLAHESAACRGNIERATLTRDAAAITVMRRQRLERALAFGVGLVQRAWREAGGPVAGEPPLELRIEPNPVRVDFALLFGIPEAADARLEIFDVQGRRWAERDLGRMEAGVHRILIEREWLREVPAGMFVARVTAGTATIRGRFTRVAP